jgi:hypothetical protein
MPTLIRLFLMVVLSYGKARADEFSDRFPECNVLQSRHCNQQFEMVGHRMNCYRNYIRSTQACSEKVSKYTREWKIALSDREAKEKALVKIEAGKALETNFTRSAGVTIENANQRALEKVEASSHLRNYLGALNRQIIPGFESASSRFTALLKEAGSMVNINLELSRLQKTADSIDSELDKVINNHRFYENYFTPRLQGLKFDENKIAFRQILEKTHLYLQDAEGMQVALKSLKVQLGKIEREERVSQKKEPNVSKSEIVLQKMLQSKSVGPSDREYEFFHRLCLIENKLNPKICDLKERQ